MYLEHFRLSETPFSLTPNTSFFFGLAPHVEALQVLQAALQTGEGFLKVTGEVGTGKTLICRKLLNELPSWFRCAYVPNPYLTPEELRWAVAIELGITYCKEVGQQQLTQLIQQKLVGLAAGGFNTVLVLDEAQAIPGDSLEALRLFTNLETESHKLLQVVLFGQPELDQRLAEVKYRQLRQRITFSYRLRPLTKIESHGYINHRLSIAGYTGKPLFSRQGIRLISKASRGVPRLINVLSHKAMMLSYGEGDDRIRCRHIKGAIKDTEDTRLDELGLLILSVLLIGSLAAAIVWSMMSI